MYKEVICPVFDRDGITLYCGDFTAIAAELPAVDLAIVDPPYGQTSLSWDRWVTGWAKLVDCDSMWCFGSLRMFVQHWAEFDGWKMSQDVVWEKHNGSSFHSDRFRRVHEQAVHFYRGKWSGIVHECPKTMDARRRTVRRNGSPQHMGAIGEATYTSIDGGPRLMRSVIPARSMHRKAVHPTQKPVGLLRPLIEYGSREGQTILDPFCGSASTLVAARELGRRAIGVEVSEEYCSRAVERLSERTLF